MIVLFFQSLLEVHTGFSVELSRTCTTLVHKIFEVFIKWKTKFLLYGDYCSNLPRAQEHIEELTRKNEVVKTSIEVSTREVMSCLPFSPLHLDGLLHTY